MTGETTEKKIGENPTPSSSRKKKDAENATQKELIGTFSAEYSCLYQLARGTLVTGSEGMLFDGNFFFVKQRIFLDWLDVLQVQKEEFGRIVILDRENRKHEFNGLQHLDRVWSSLVSLHSDALREAPLSKVEEREHQRQQQKQLTAAEAPVRSLRRMNSNPLPSPKYDGSDQHSSTLRTFEDSVTTSTTTTAGTGSAAATVAAHLLAKTPTTPSASAKASAAAEGKEEDPTSSSSESAAEVADDKDKKEEGVKNDDAAVERLLDDNERAWAKLQQDNAKLENSPNGEVSIQNLELPCDLKTFFDTFLADEAPCSIPRFMEISVGDTDMKTSPWTEEDDGSFKRTISYCHPINAPLAPPTANARKEQRYRRYGDFGLEVLTDTYVDELPLADCFYVTDRLLVESAEDGRGDSNNNDNKRGRIVVTASFGIEFVKSTMFGAIITNTTKKTFLKMGQKLSEYMMTGLKDQVPLSKETNGTKGDVPEIEKTVTSSPLSLSETSTQPPPSLDGGSGTSPLLLKILLLLVMALLFVNVSLLGKINSLEERMTVLEEARSTLMRTDEMTTTTTTTGLGGGNNDCPENISDANYVPPPPPEDTGSIESTNNDL